MKSQTVKAPLAISLVSLLLTTTGSTQAADTLKAPESAAVRHVQLRGGNALVEGETTTDVVTNEGHLVVEPGAEAFVMSGKEGVAIFALSENSHGNIQFIAN